MQITLTPELEQIIKQQMELGGFPSPEDVVRAALLQLFGEPELAPGKLESLIAEGQSAADRGEFIDGAKAYAERHQRRARGGSEYP